MLSQRFTPGQACTRTLLEAQPVHNRHDGCVSQSPGPVEFGAFGGELAEEVDIADGQGPAEPLGYVAVEA